MATEVKVTRAGDFLSEDMSETPSKSMDSSLTFDLIVKLPIVIDMTINVKQVDVLQQ